MYIAQSYVATTTCNLEICNLKIGTEEVYIISLTVAVVRIILLVDYILYNLHEFLEYLNEQPLKLTEFRSTWRVRYANQIQEL